MMLLVLLLVDNINNTAPQAHDFVWGVALYNFIRFKVILPNTGATDIVFVTYVLHSTMVKRTLP